MERTSLSGLAPPHAGTRAAGGLQRLRQGLESLTRSRLVAWWQELLLTSIALIAGVRFTAFAFERHDAFQSNAYDLGFFDQIIWNTSQGRLFETSFVHYNFLGQHFDPVLLLFAGLYALGGGVKTLLVIQAGAAALASVPLFLAVRRISGHGTTALACSLAFLLNPHLHTAIEFDFHPETMSFVFVFTSLYFLAAAQPVAAAAAVLPVLLLKEDMALVVLAVALLLGLRGYRQAACLAGVAIAWVIVVVMIGMPALRGGEGSDLTRRYGYLIEDTTVLTAVPTAVIRGSPHLWELTIPSLLELLTSGGWAGLFSPAALVLAVPNLLISGLADHPQQAQLDLHYGVSVLALLWVAVALGLGNLSSRRWRGPGVLTPVRLASLVLVTGAAVSFLGSSPYAPGKGVAPLSAAHASALQEALRLIPPDASVGAQSAILPHLSQRRDVYEFPDERGGEYVIVDALLPKSSQSRDAGFDTRLARISDEGYTLVFSDGPVRLYRRTP